jgi:ABC-type transport system substrate-binding protein
MFGVVPEGGHGERTEEKGTAGRLGTDLSRAPVGTGPYKFVDWKSGSKIVLEKNENYWKEGVPVADRAEFEFIGDPSAKLAALISGAVHIIDKVPFRDYQTIKGMPKIATKRMPGTALQILYLNLSNPPLGISEEQVGDQEEIERARHVRKFLYHAIDRKALAEELFYGMATVAKGPWYPDSEWTSPELEEMQPHDPELAREHLEKAGFAEGGLSFEMQATNAQWFVDMATVIQEQLRGYGVKSEVVPVDKATLFDTMYESVDWDILVEDWVFSDFSVLSYLGFNYPWNNWSPNHWHHQSEDLRDLYHPSVPGHKEWSDLYDKTVMQTDEQRRKEMVWELQEIVVDKVVGIDLLIVDSLYAWRDEIEGYGEGLDSIGIVDLRFVEGLGD